MSLPMRPTLWLLRVEPFWLQLCVRRQQARQVPQIHVHNGQVLRMFLLVVVWGQLSGLLPGVEQARRRTLLAVQQSCQLWVP